MRFKRRFFFDNRLKIQRDLAFFGFAADAARYVDAFAVGTLGNNNVK